jgi:hypothetical protein
MRNPKPQGQLSQYSPLAFRLFLASRLRTPRRGRVCKAVAAVAVKRWRGGQMMLRWVAAGILEAVKGFRRLKGYADMPMLVAALRARDRQLGLSDAQEERQIA